VPLPESEIDQRAFVGPKLNRTNRRCVPLPIRPSSTSTGQGWAVSICNHRDRDLIARLGLEGKRNSPVPDPKVRLTLPP
jgi:hypothetical protein